MSAAYKQDPVVVTDPFSTSRDLFEGLVRHAGSAGCLAAGHAEVEQTLWESGRAVLRQLFQDHLDMRHSREPRVEVVNEDGIRLTERRVARRTLRPLLGDLRVTWWLYQAEQEEGRAPADAGLRLCEDSHSMGIRREVARLSAHEAFAPSAVTLERLTGVHVAQRQVEELARRAAEDVCDLYLRSPPRRSRRTRCSCCRSTRPAS